MYKIINKTGIIIIFILFGCVGNKTGSQIIANSNNIENLVILHNEVKTLLIDTLFQMEDKYYVYNSYGLFECPFTGNLKFRNYMFINSKYNSKVFSISDGEVIEIGYDIISGNYIKIKYNEIEIIYGNLLKLEINTGVFISIGDIIGYGGPHGPDGFGNGITIRIKYKDNFLNPYLLLKNMIITRYINYENGKKSYCA